MKCVVITVTYMVELKDRVLAPSGPSSISAVAELLYFYSPNGLFLGLETVLGSTHVVVQLSFCMFLSILVLIFT